MAHSHLRHDKTCLNCGAEVQDRYCSTCGQENIETKESFWHLIGHFIGDEFHYDSKLFTTVKDLIIKPGFLTKEYNVGKRTSYLNPIRMYVFISAVFFLVIFSRKEEKSDRREVNQAVNEYKQHLADSLQTLSKHQNAVSSFDSLKKALYSTLASSLGQRPAAKKDDSLTVDFTNRGELTFLIKSTKYASVKQYRLEQAKLPVKDKDDFLSTLFTEKAIVLAKSHKKEELVLHQNIEHELSESMFILLPAFALFLGFFYGRKKFAYSQHLIFSLHFYSFMFLVLIISSLIGMDWSLNTTLFLWAICFLLILSYLGIALHVVYRQSIWMSFLKALLVSFINIGAVVCCVLVLAIINFFILS